LPSTCIIIFGDIFNARAKIKLEKKSEIRKKFTEKIILKN